MRGERHAPPPHVALRNSGESNRETPHGGGVRRAEKRGGGVNEWNSSRCVTEYYITLSLHMHGAGTHTHTRGGGDSRHTRVHTPCSAAAGWGGGPGARCGAQNRRAGALHTPSLGSPTPTCVSPHGRRHPGTSVMSRPHSACGAAHTHPGLSSSPRSQHPAQTQTCTHTTSWTPGITCSLGSLSLFSHL